MLGNHLFCFLFFVFLFLLVFLVNLIPNGKDMEIIEHVRKSEYHQGSSVQ